MPRQSSLNVSRLPALPAIASGIAFTATTAFLVGPRSTPVLLPILAATLFFLGANYRQRPQLPWTGLFAALLLFGIYLAINASWSVAPGLAVGKVALYFVFVVMVGLGTTSFEAIDGYLIERAARGALLAAGISTAFLTIEVLLDSPVQKTVLSMLPFLRPESQKHVSISDDWVVNIRTYVLNRNIAALCLLLWPMSLIAAKLLDGSKARIAATVLFIATITATAFSQHESSMLALTASTTIFALAWRWPKAAIGLTGTGWLIATLLVVPIAVTAYANKLHLAEWIPKTGRARIIIWDYTAEQVLKRPLLGVGIQSTKPLDKVRARIAEKPKGFAYPRRTGRHSHNIFMQTWYELGAIGAMLLFASGLMLLDHIRKLRADIRPYALATFSGAAVIASFSWGMWQPWFMAAFGLTALLTALAIRVGETSALRNSPSEPTSHHKRK